MPFAGLLQKAVTLLFPDKPDEDGELEEEIILDERLLAHPALALEQAQRALLQMATSSFKNLQRATELFTKFNPEKFDKIMSREERVDRFEDRLGAYLVRLHMQPLSDQETGLSAKYLTCLSNIERISDHAVNLSELARDLADRQITFSPQAMQELTVCVDAVHEIIELTNAALRQNDLASARSVEPLEETIDQLTKALKDRHIQRLQAGQCTLALGFIYNDAINNFERISDHCSNIAVAVLEANDAHVLPHAYLHALEETGEAGYRSQLAVYQEKYLAPLTPTEV
jgi:phosphate:Na+ symporter